MIRMPTSVSVLRSSARVVGRALSYITLALVSCVSACSRDHPLTRMRCSTPSPDRGD